MNLLPINPEQALRYRHLFMTGLVYAAWLVLGGASLAMELLPAEHAMAESRSPYAGFEDREINALSESEIEGYLEGKGMGQAMAAELNGFPGPKHVLELADELELSPEQRDRTQDIFDRMQDKAVDLGRRIVEKERELDRSFASNRINQSILESKLRELFKLKAQLRIVHLSAHLSQRSLLTPIQRRTYQELRGYIGSSSSRSRAHDHH